MAHIKFRQRVIGFILFIIIVSLAGYGDSAAAEPPTPTPAPSGLLKLVRTVQVTLDDHFKDHTVPGGGGNILYVPATGRLVVIIKTSPPNTPIVLPPLTESDNPGLDTCPLGVMGYIEYTTDMQPTGKYGYLFCDIGDWNSFIIGNDVYLVKVWNKGPGTPDFWRLYKCDAVTWKKLGEVDIPLDNAKEISDGPTFSLINGLVTVSGQFFPGGTPTDPFRGSHHHFVTTDLELMGKKILVPPDVPSHCPEVSLQQLSNGDILMFAASRYVGDLVLLRFDEDWKFIDERTLRSNAFFPLGTVAYGGYWFVAYYDVSKKRVGDLPLVNVGFAAFDANWNLVQDEKVTDFDIVPAGAVQTAGDGTSVQLVGNRLYVSYTVSKFAPGGRKTSEQTYVNVYELNPSFSPPAVQPTPLTQPGQPGG